MRMRSLLYLILLQFTLTQATSTNFNKLFNGKDLGPEEREFIAESLIPSYLRSHLAENKTSPKLSSGCARHLTEWILELANIIIPGKNVSTWALHMVDSWSKIPEGILSGNLQGRGDFDECVQVQAEYFEDLNKRETFTTQYCNAIIFPSFLFPEGKNDSASKKAVSLPELIEMMLDFERMPLMFPSLAICLPASCDENDVTQYLNEYLFQGIAEAGLYMPCVPGGDRDFSTGTIIMIGVFTFLGALCIGAGIADILLINKEKSRIKSQKSELPEQQAPQTQDSTPKYGLGLRILLSFSIYTNTKRLMNTNPSGDNLGCLHGIRFLSICWVVIGHTWTMALGTLSIWNLVAIRRIHENHWSLNTILNATVSVDTFFTMSGLLVAYNLLKLLEKRKGSFNVPMFYIHRYLRLTPMYALLIGFMATILPHLTNGPMRGTIELNAEMCRKYWWHNLLYFNNLYTYPMGEQTCEGETWYISNDMQFFIISPIFIYALWRWEKIGMGLLSLATIGSIITPSVIIAENDLDPTMLIRSLMENDFMAKIYIKPWSRIGPYLIGIWAGFLLFKIKKMPNFRLSWPVALGGWALSTGTAFAIIYAPYRWNNPEEEIGKVEAWIYGGFHRTIWGLVIAWIIFACMNGRGGIINEFLSWKAFMPLGRLSFAIYLVSLQVQNVININKGKHPINYSTFNMVLNFFSEMTLSTLMAFICTVTMESPFMQIEKIIFGRFG